MSKYLDATPIPTPQLILRSLFLCATWMLKYGKRRNDRIVRTCAAGPDAVEPMAFADRYLARRDVDSRWSRSHPRRVVRRNLNASRDSRIYRYTGLRQRDFLSRGRRARRAAWSLRNL